METSNLVAMPLHYLDKALNRLRDLGLMPEKPNETPMVELIKKIKIVTTIRCLSFIH